MLERLSDFLSESAYFLKLEEAKQKMTDKDNETNPINMPGTPSLNTPVFTFKGIENYMASVVMKKKLFSS